MARSLLNGRDSGRADLAVPSVVHTPSNPGRGLDPMKPLALPMVQYLSMSLFAFGLSACSGDDETQGKHYDAAAIEAAPTEAKTQCERACSAADQVRAQKCGETEFATHSECYTQCVGRYLDHPECSDAFDSANTCIGDAVCSAQTECVFDMISAVACMQAPSGGG